MLNSFISANNSYCMAVFPMTGACDIIDDISAGKTTPWRLLKNMAYLGVGAFCIKNVMDGTLSLNNIAFTAGVATGAYPVVLEIFHEMFAAPYEN